MRLIRGAPGSGKTALVFREFSAAVRAGREFSAAVRAGREFSAAVRAGREFSAAGPRADESASNALRIVVPTATLVRHYQHELARTGLVFDPNTVVSFSRFALDRAPELSLVSADLVRALVRSALARLQLPEFARAAETRGMADVIVETITSFENAGCTPERLSGVRALSPHGKAFLRVWKEVDAAIAARGFCTRGQLFRRAATAGAPETAWPRKIWMDGFLKFSPLESGFLRAIAANCDLTLTLTEGQTTYDTYRLAMELGAKDQLLPGAARSPQTIAVKAPSPEREADEIARRILELHGQGVEFSGIAIALRDVEGWLPLLRSTFDRFGIPARYYFSAPARRHPVAVFLSGLIACALKDWDFAATLAALRAHPAWGHSADFDRFDFRVREAMPGRGAEAFLALCESGSLRPRIADCLKLTAWRGERLLPAVWRRRFAEMAESFYRIRTIANPADYAAVETARSHAAGLRAWAAALDTAANFWRADAGAVTLDQFHAVVSDALDSAGMRIPDDRRNAVHVMSAFEARQWEVRALFICGMTARDYPRRASENLLFPDSDLERLRRAGIPLRTAADEDRDEEALFDSLKTVASETLVLTASARDTGGKTIVPSRHFSPSVTNKSVRVAAKIAVPALTSVPGYIGGESLAALSAHHSTVSLSSLEDLMKCRFRFFSGRTLGLKGVPDRPEERFSYSAAGLIIHKAMEIWLAGRTRNFVDIFETTFDAFCREHGIGPGYKLEVQRVLLRRVAHKVNESVRWPVLSSEMEIECSIDFPGGVTVTCRVDRIDDIGGGNCVIVDYKSGKVENVEKLVESQTSLQGPLYGLAVREKKQLNPVAMVFHAVREDKIFGWGDIPGSGLKLLSMPADWIDSARDRTIARLQSFLAGDVHAEPANPGDCQWCDFKNACRVETREAEPGIEIVKIGAAGGD